MKFQKASIAMCAAAAMTLGMLAVPAHARTTEEAMSARQASSAVMVSDIHVHDGLVSGKVVNKSGESLHNVKLMIDHTWLWKNERHPGIHSPSRTDFYTLPQTIPPHGTVAFEYRPNPLPQRTDGRFDTIVKVMEFEQVGMRQAAR